MNKTFALAVLLATLPVMAAQNAVTENGAVVILNEDGTWKYADDNQRGGHEIKENKASFRKDPGQSFQIKSTRNNAAVWVDPKQWIFRREEGAVNAAEYKFKARDSDLYGMLITEQIEIGLDNLPDLAFENARNFAPDVRVVSKEYRTVNGIRVVHMRMDGSAQGAKFTYLGYYYADKHGSTQLVAYTSANLVDKYQAQMEAFLNGFALQ